MTVTDRRPDLDTYADALAALAAASDYNYELGASYQAALDRLAAVDHTRARHVAAALAALTAEWALMASWSAAPLPLAAWVRHGQCETAAGGTEAGL